MDKLLEEREIYEEICMVSCGVTDFVAGFDRLFEFMAENPDSNTTRRFIDYHLLEMGDPRDSNGKPLFTYLIGRRFFVYDWVSKEDLQEFIKII